MEKASLTKNLSVTLRHAPYSWRDAHVLGTFWRRLCNPTHEGNFQLNFTFRWCEQWGSQVALKRYVCEWLIFKKDLSDLSELCWCSVPVRVTWKLQASFGWKIVIGLRGFRFARVTWLERPSNIDFIFGLQWYLGMAMLSGFFIWEFQTNIH